MEGRLHCRGCGESYAVGGGVPRLVPSEVPVLASETARRFGLQWKTFIELETIHEKWLREWLAPIGPEHFQGKTVLEAGCGKGRHTVIAAGWGPSDLVALDLGDAVDVCFEHTRHQENVHVVQGDILRPPLRAGFDLAFSVGVLHHLPDPREGFDRLRGLIRPDGKIAIWVYGRENNEWIVRYVNPVRERVTARLPARILYWVTLPPSAALAAATRVYKLDGLARHLPYGDYLKAMSELPAREVHNIVFDQLVTPVAFYLAEDEVRRWFEQKGLRDVEIHWHRKMSWRASATVTG